MTTTTARKNESNRRKKQKDFLLKLKIKPIKLPGKTGLFVPYMKSAFSGGFKRVDQEILSKRPRGKGRPKSK